MDSEDADLEIDASLPRGRPGRERRWRGFARSRWRFRTPPGAGGFRCGAADGFSAGGFENRQGAKMARTLILGSFLLVVALPTFCAILYFGFIAADQYIVESEFTVSAGELPMRDGVDP